MICLLHKLPSAYKRIWIAYRYVYLINSSCIKHIKVFLKISSGYLFNPLPSTLLDIRQKKKPFLTYYIFKKKKKSNFKWSSINNFLFLYELLLTKKSNKWWSDSGFSINCCFVAAIIWSTVSPDYRDKYIIALSFFCDVFVYSMITSPRLLIAIVKTEKPFPRLGSYFLTGQIIHWYSYTDRIILTLVLQDKVLRVNNLHTVW